MTHYTPEYQKLLFELQHLRWRAQHYRYSLAQLEQDLNQLQARVYAMGGPQRGPLLDLLESFRGAIGSD